MPTGQHSSSGQWLYSSRLFLQSASLPCLLSRCDLGLNCDKHSPPSSCHFSLAAGSESHSLSLSAAVLGPQATVLFQDCRHPSQSAFPDSKTCHSGASRTPSPHDSREVITVCGAGAMPFPLWKSRWTIFHLLAVGLDGLGLTKWVLTLDFESGADRGKQECGSRWHSSQLLLLKRQLSPLSFLPSWSPVSTMVQVWPSTLSLVLWVTFSEVFFLR